MKNLQIQFVNDQATHACETCKRRKRRCDKGLPRCSACMSKGLRCEYLESTPKINDGLPHFIDLSISQRNQAQRSELPNVFFLDHNVFQKGQMSIPTPSLPIPSYVSDKTGGDTEIRNTAASFFATVHSYLPIVSKKIFYDLLLNPLLQRRADVAFLCLCMKVIVWASKVHDSEPQTADYLAAKQNLLELESAGVFTVPVLQGRLLLSMFEYGHSIYPAAYISIGACAAHAYGLGLSATRVLDGGGRKLTWVEQEERRRVWWAIVILERIVYLGSVGRPLVTHDPTASDVLPSDDTSWDQGVTSPNYPINSPVGSQVNMGRFARLAHATHLLALVIRHTSFSFSDSQIREEEIVQLDRTIRALMVVCEQESQRTRLRFCNPLSICASALLVLHSHYASVEISGTTAESSRHRERSRIAMENMSLHLVVGFRQSLKMACEVLPEVSPLVLHSVYKAGVVFVQLSRDSSSEGMTEELQVVKETLKMKNAKWKTAGAYLEILEAREIMNTY